MKYNSITREKSLITEKSDYTCSSNTALYTGFILFDGIEKNELLKRLNDIPMNNMVNAHCDTEEQKQVFGRVIKIKKKISIREKFYHSIITCQCDRPCQIKTYNTNVD